MELNDKVFPHLTHLWVLPNASYAEIELHSVSIVHNFVQILSDLYYQTFAWDEMSEEFKSNISTSILTSHEIIGYR